MIEVVYPSISERYSFSNESILKNLPDYLYDLIDENSTVLRLKKGQVLFHEGTTPTGVYIVKKGKIKKYTKGILGKEHIFYLVKENEIIGCHELISEEAHFCTAECLVDCEIKFISKKVFLDEILTADKILLKRLLVNMSHEFGVFINNSRILAQHNVRERSAISILRLSKFFNGKSKANGEEKPGFKISRKDHSSLVGTSVESLVRTLHEFKEEKIIEIKESTIYILDMNKLVKASNLM